MKKHILVFGLIYGILSLILSYFMFQGSVGPFKGAGLSILILIVIQITSVIVLKKERRGIVSFSEIVLLCLGVAMLGFVVSLIGNQVYLALLSPEEKQVFITRFVDLQMDYLESLGLPFTPEMEESMIKTAEDSMSLKSILTSLPMMAFISVIIGMVLGLIFKKDYEV